MKLYLKVFENKDYLVKRHKNMKRTNSKELRFGHNSGPFQKSKQNHMQVLGARVLHRKIAVYTKHSA